MTRRLTPRGWWVRGVILLGPVLALFAGGPQGFWPPIWLAVVVAAGSCAFAALPDQFAGSATMLLVLGYWTVDVGRAMPASAVVAAAGLLGSHVAATIASYGPDRLEPDGPAVLLWVRRSVLVWLVAPALWLVVDAYRGHTTPATFWVAGLAVTVVLAVGSATWFPTRLDQAGTGGR